MSNPLKALIEFTSAYQQYATKDGQANPAATTHAQMQELFKNWSEILAALTNSIWQPSKIYSVGQIVSSPNMQPNTAAICLTAGTSGSSEPEWEQEGTTVIDNGVTWNKISTIGLAITITDGLATIKSPLGDSVLFDQIKVDKLSSNLGITIADGGVPTASANDNNVPTTGWVRTLIEANASTFAPKPCYNRRLIRVDDGSVKLYWRDPEDTIADGNVIATWTKTVIVKKLGVYPADPTDGVVVATNTTKNLYADTPYIDRGETDGYLYRAFPYNQESYSSSELNKFEFFSYAVYIDESDPVEASCVHKVPGFDNYFLDNCFMNFVDNEFYWGGWKDEPWLPKPCMLKYSGEVDYYLNQDDYTKKEDGVAASDVTNTAYEGNAMMEWGPIFTKVKREGKRLYIYAASHKLDDDYECYSCLKSDGSYGEHFYMPIYEGSVINSKLRSMSTGAKPTASTTAENEAVYAANNGANWTTTVWADEQLMQIMGVILFGRLNFQVACGYNCGSNSSALTHNCGSGNTKGMFYGQASTSAYATKFFGMENWWGHRWRRPNGLMLINYTVYVKMTRHTGDGSTATDYNRTGAGYINTGLTIPSASESYIKQTHGEKLGAFVPKIVSGSSATTYFCDACWSASGTTMLLLGGGVNSGALAGLFAFSVDYAPSFASWNVGASVSYKPF